MMKLCLIVFSSVLMFSLLCACAPFRPDSTHAGVCNELNSQMIFSGATSNDRQAEIENASLPLQQRTYDRARCE